MRDRIALVRFIESRIGMPHDYRRNDCARFVLGAVRAQFGRTPKLGVSWTTERGAKRAIARLGGFEAAADRLFAAIDPGQAQFGDIAGVIDPVRGFHVMLVEGQQLVGPGERGLTRLPRSAMVRAWSADPSLRRAPKR